jgi:hypothetical protein
MKLFAVLLGALALVAGFTGGLRAYSTSAHAGDPVTTARVTVPHYPRAQVVRPGPVIRWAPCTPPAHRVGNACVTTVVHTVTLPAPAAASSSAAPAAATVRAPAPRPVRTASTSSAPRPSGGGEHEDDGGGGHDD